jgi:hypothetical protein
MANEQGRADHVANTMPSPYYHFDGASDEIRFATTTLKKEGWGAHVRFKWGDNATTAELLGNIQQVYFKYIRFQNTTSFVIEPDTDYNAISFATQTMIPGNTYDIVITGDTSGTQLYINGVLEGSTGTALYDSITLERIGHAYYTNWMEGDIYGVKLYNTKVTADEVKELYSGASVPWKYKGASQTNQFSNPTMIDADGNGLAEGVNANKANCSIVTGNGFTGNAQRAEYNTSQTGIQGIYVPTSCPAGKVTRVSFKYRSNYSMSLHNGSYHFGPHFPVNTGDAAEFSFDFIHTGVGGENIYVSSWLYLAGEWFEISDLSVTQVGTVAEYDGSSATELVWFDKSSNGLDGTVTGATLENKEADLYIDGFAHIGISDTSHHISSVKSKLTVYTVGDTTWPETNYRNVGTSAGDNKGFSVGIGKLAGDQTGYIWQGEDDDIEFWTNDKKRMILTSGGELVVTGSAPQIKLVDSDAHADDFWLHANSDSFYVLTDRNNDGDFADANVAVWNSANSTCTIDGTVDTTVTEEVDCVTAPEWAPPLILANATQDALLYGSKVVTASSFSLVGTVLTITI